MFKNIVNKYKKELFILGIGIIIYFLYFHNLWSYKLLDVDETRYVDMARHMNNTKDFMTLYLNDKFFFEKPPLYFWLENLSFNLFGAINEFTARIPGCIESILSACALFFVTKKYTNNIKKALISSLILLSSVEYIMLSKIAILDILLAVTVTISLLCGFMTFKSDGKLKTFYWWGFYLFSGVAVLAKGIPGIVLPFGTMFFIGLYSKKLKEYFNPKYCIPGMILFLIIVLPWHIIMLNKYDPLFFNEYIMKHHIARFLGAEEIHRQRPFWYFIPVILWGCAPYVASFLAMIAEKCSNLKNYKYVPFAELSCSRQFTIFCIIASVFTFLFFSSSGSKLVTYILPIYPFLSVIIANYWVEYIENNEHKKGIEISTNILLYTLLCAGIIAFFVFMFIPEPVKSDLYTIRIPMLCATIPFPLLGIWAVKKDKRELVFASLLLFITFISGFVFHKALEMDYRFGQNDLIEYAQFAKNNKLNISTYNTGQRYSLLYYSQNHVNFDIDEKDFDKTINNPKNIIIIRNKHMALIEGKKYQVVKTGRKYTMIRGRGRDKLIN